MAVLSKIKFRSFLIFQRKLPEENLFKQFWNEKGNYRCKFLLFYKNQSAQYYDFSELKGLKLLRNRSWRTDMQTNYRMFINHANSRM